MSRKDTLRRIDQGIAAAGGAAVSITVAGGSSGGVSNADTVDGYHASSVPTAGKLLALNTAAHFAASVIDWGSVAGAGLDDSGDTLVVQWGTSPTTIVPDAATNGGSAATSARSDHTHAIATAAPAANLTVVTANAEGNATSFARSNHTHAITTSANPGAAASILASNVNGYLQLVRLGLGVAPSVALQAQGTTPQLRIQSDASHYATFGADGNGNLTITPSGNSLLLPGGKTLSSTNWASQTTGWGIYPESTYGRDGYADFRYIYADELHVKAFIADLEQALAGGQIISKSVAILAADFTIPAKGSTATLKVEDLPGTTAAVFVSGDWIRIRNISRSGGGLVVADCYGTVGAATLNGDGTQSYTFSRPASDTGSATTGTVVPKGGLALDYGVSGNGYWEVTTLDPAGSPYAQVATWATHPQNRTVRARLGNLDGIAGIGAEWGLWAGTDVNHQFKASSGSVELRGIPQYWLDASNNVRGAVDPTATGSNYLFWLGPSSGDKRFGVDANGTVYIGNVPSGNVAGWAYSGDVTKIDGGDIYAGSVTADKFNAHGANQVANAGFELGTLTDWVSGTGSPAVITTTNVHSGAYALRVTGNGVDNMSAAQQTYLVEPGANYYAGVWTRLYSGVTGSAGLYITWLDAADATISTTAVYGPATESYTLKSTIVAAPSNAYKARLALTVRSDVNGNALFDDAEFYRADGRVLVGTPGGARVEIASAGIEGRDSTNNLQFQIRTSDGRGMFGDEHGVLDKYGLTLSGNDTSYNTYDGIRWMTQVDPPGGNQVARILAGRWGGLSNYYELLVETNPDLLAGYPSDIGLRANTKSASDTGNGRNYIRGGLYLSSQIIQASAILSTEVDEGEGNAAIQVIGESTNSYIKFLTKDTERMRIAHDGMITLTGRVGIGASSPSYPLHVANSDTVKLYLNHTATTSNRALVVNRRNSSDNGALEWYQEFATGDTPEWNFTRVSRPDGGTAVFSTPFRVYWDGGVWVYGACSAASFIDRTPYPDRDTALAAVRSMRQADRATGELDHEALHEYVRGKSDTPGRNLSATVSAQNAVIQELLDRIDKLETERRVL